MFLSLGCYERQKYQQTHYNSVEKGKWLYNNYILVPLQIALHDLDSQWIWSYANKYTLHVLLHVLCGINVGHKNYLGYIWPVGDIAITRLGA